MYVKSITLTPVAALFLPDDIRSKISANLPLSDEESAFVEKTCEFLGVSDFKQTVTLTTTIENFLIGLFLSLPTPSSPLKLRSHQRMIDSVSKILEATVDTDQLPEIPKQWLDLVKPLVEDDDKFETLDVPFDLKKGSEVVSIPLKSSNVTNSIGFLDCIEAMFPEKECDNTYA